MYIHVFISLKGLIKSQQDCCTLQHRYCMYIRYVTHVCNIYDCSLRFLKVLLCRMKSCMSWPTLALDVWPSKSSALCWILIMIILLQHNCCGILCVITAFRRAPKLFQKDTKYLTKIFEALKKVVLESCRVVVIIIATYINIWLFYFV